VELVQVVRNRDGIAIEKGIARIVVES